MRRPTDKEREWCSVRFLIPRALKEILISYEDLKKRFRLMGLHRAHLRRTPSPDFILLLKLSLCASFNSNFLVSTYATDDEIVRRKRAQVLNNDKKKFVIHSVPAVVQGTDIKQCLSNTRAKELTVDFLHGSAVVSIDEAFWPRPMQMAL